MATSNIHDEVSIFQEARRKVQNEIDEIIQSLEHKKDEMLSEISELENEYSSKQQQKQSRIQSLKKSISELGQLAVRKTIIQDLQDELNIATNELVSTGNVDFEWGFSKDVITKIKTIQLIHTECNPQRAIRATPPIPPKPNFVHSFERSFQTENTEITNQPEEIVLKCIPNTEEELPNSPQTLATQALNLESSIIPTNLPEPADSHVQVKLRRKRWESSSQRQPRPYTMYDRELNQITDTRGNARAVFDRGANGKHTQPQEFPKVSVLGRKQLWESKARN